MVEKFNIKQWFHERANNQKIALLAGMEAQVNKLPEFDARTMLIQARIAKLRASIDWTLGLEDEEVLDGSDSE
jgi:hypothetical protein